MRGTDVVGWGSAGARWTDPDAWSVSRAIAEALHSLGIRDAFGVLGGGIAPFSAGLAASPIAFHHFRHEAGAGFAAIEAHFATRAPTALVVTTGPGIFNALNPVMAARIDGAKLLMISGFTSRFQAGRGAVQETSRERLPAELSRMGSLFDEVLIPENPEEIPPFLERLQRRFASPGGCVAHLGLPLSLQTRLVNGPFLPVRPWIMERPAPSPTSMDACLEALLDPDALVWVGHGARDASAVLRQFVEEASLPTISSPRGKGIFPEEHPLFVGVSGASGNSRVRRRFERRPPRTVLVIGTRLGEVTSFLMPAVTPREQWIHVDIDPSAFGGAFPGVSGMGILSDAGDFLRALLARATETGWFAKRREAVGDVVLSAVIPAEPGLEPRAAEVRPPYLMQMLQKQVVEATDAVVMSEAGTSFTWCNALLRFAEPHRYRTSAAWGSMGHFTTGCVGAAISGDRRVVAVVGDGALLMNNEINTAVQYRARVIWVVLNDAQLGLNEQGMNALGMAPVETQMPRTDFVQFARSQGADGIAVNTEVEVESAISLALAAAGPFVLDVRIDRSVLSPVIADRVRSLGRQAGAAARES